MTQKDFDKDTQKIDEQFPIVIYLDVKSLSRGPLGDSEVFSVKSEDNKIPLDDENVLVSFVGEVGVIRLEDELLANFSISYQTETICARCLETYKRKGSAEFDREYLVFGKDDGGEKLSVEKHFKINVGAPIYEELMFDIPLKPLCKEGCKGITEVRRK